MHYYQFNIGDYASHTRGLSLLEDLAYRRLLDEYYLHESPLLSGAATMARQIGMREYEKEVEFVLKCFFTLTEKGWIHSRADKEIEHFHSKIEQASKAGKASAERRLNGRSTDSSTDVQPTNNQQPITNKQETNKKATKVAATTVACPVGVSTQTWDDFKTLRKAKKAPITQRAIDGITSEAEKAGWSLEQALVECVMRGWQAFKADWVNKSLIAHGFKPDVVHITTPTPKNHDAALRKIEEDAKKAVKPNADVQAKIAELLKPKVKE